MNFTDAIATKVQNVKFSSHTHQFSWQIFKRLSLGMGK